MQNSKATCQARQHTRQHITRQPRQRNSTGTPNSTARQLLDAQAHGVSLDRLDRNSTGTRQARQGSTGKASTAPRQRARQRLDGASTARQLDSQGSSTQAVRALGGPLTLGYFLTHRTRTTVTHGPRRGPAGGGAAGGRYSFWIHTLFPAPD